MPNPVEPPEPTAEEQAEYEKFVESMVSYCRCSPSWGRPCAGVLAGGLCDDLGNNDDRGEMGFADEDDE